MQSADCATVATQSRCRSRTGSGNEVHSQQGVRGRTTCCQRSFLALRVEDMTTIEEHRRCSTEFCRKKYFGESEGKAVERSKAITRDRGVRIVNLLRDDETPKFKHWVKKKEFKLLSYPSLGLVNVNCLPAKAKVCVN